jgi:hypothetical protein
MTRRRVYETLWRMRARARLLQNDKDREDFDGLISDMGKGIFGWEQDIKRSLVPFHITNKYLAGDPMTWLDEDLEDDDDDKKA